MNAYSQFHRLARRTFAACFVLILIALTLFFSTPFPSRAAGAYIVNNLGDADDSAPGDGICETGLGNGICTLRAAIHEANATPGAGTITITATGTIILGSSLPNITQDLMIDGPGASLLTISGNNSFRVLRVIAVMLNLMHVTIANGSSTGGGGGVFVDAGTLFADSVTFSGNRAVSNNGGAINNSSGTVTLLNTTILSNTASGTGGGIYTSNGTLNITNSTLYSNTASSDGGGIYSTSSAFFLTSSNVYSNTAVNANGGAIYNNNSALIISSTAITSNVAISNSNSTGFGGGIYNSGSLLLTNSQISNNTANNGGGAIFAITTTATITNTTLSRNRANGGFGGGAVLISPNGAMNLDNATLSDNVATNIGGAIGNLGVMTITNSSIYSNTSATYGGGGIWNIGIMTMTNLTIVNNRALAGNGGGIYNSCFTMNCTNPGVIKMTSGTIAGNNAPFGGGIFNDNSLSVALTNTIVANNAAGTGANCLGTITDGGKNLQWNPNTGCGFALAAGDPKLAPLANYGGATKTMGLFIGSAAIDAGLNAACPATDQRGVARPRTMSNPCDIGAFEGFLYPLHLPLIMR